MKNILIVNQSANYLMVDIARAFVSSGMYNNVVLLVGNPQSVTGAKKFGVIIDTFCPYVRTSIKTRLKSWIVGTWQIKRRIRKKYKGYELFFVSNPPTISLCHKFCSNEYSALVYDIYPDGLLGMVSKRNLIFKIWSKRNLKYYEKAKNVYTITDGMANRLSQYCPISKIKVIPLWYDNNIHCVEKENNLFIKEHHLEGKLVVMYSGNIGKAHNVGGLIDVAIKTKHEANIVFVIIGDGWEKDAIIAKVKNNNLSNVLLLPYQPVEKMSFSLSAADLSYVSSVGSTICIPSKFFNIINVETPVICIASEGTELNKLVKEYNVGGVFQPSDIGGMADFIISINKHKELLAEFKQNMIKAKNDFSPNNALEFVK